MSTSIDDLFKKPNLPSKRKLEVSHDPADYYSSAKRANVANVANVEKSTGVQDENEEDLEAGPALPSDEEDDDRDDEDGRFFGGGVERETKAALDWVNADDEDDVKQEKYDVTWLRRTAVAFEKKITKNAELRAKYPEDPSKFMQSEADLDEAIKTFSGIGDHSALLPELAKLGCMSSLVSLLSHENADIAIDAIQILSELVEEDIQAVDHDLEILADSAIEADLIPLLGQNLQRLDESNEEDRAGVNWILLLLEPALAGEKYMRAISEDSFIIPWLIKRAQTVEEETSENKQLAAELLSIYVNEDSNNRLQLIRLNVLDNLLEQIAPYRNKDPEKNSTESEWFENMFDILCCLVKEIQGKDKFLEAEGVELVLIFLKDGKLGKFRALKLLTFAIEGDNGGNVSSKIVQAGGLKPIFGIFMKKLHGEDFANILTIFSSFLSHLPIDSPERIRVLAKFVEKDYEKTIKLLSTRQLILPRIQKVLDKIELEKKSLDKIQIREKEAEWTSQKVDIGLWTLRALDLILAWLCAEDHGAKRTITQLLEVNKSSLLDIKRVLQQQIIDQESSGEDVIAIKGMIGSLISTF